MGVGTEPHFSCPYVGSHSRSKSSLVFLPSVGVEDSVYLGRRPVPGTRKALKWLWKEVRKKGREGELEGGKERRKAKTKKAGRRNFLNSYDT